MKSLSDEELVARYRSALTPSAGAPYINTLFERHQSRVLAWCYRMTGSRDRSPDLAQEVFIKAFGGLDTFRAEARFTTWLYTIVRNCCRDDLRARAARPQEVVDGELETVALTENDALATLDAESARTTVRELMRNSLDDTEMRVMTLHYGYEMPLQAVTALLHLRNASGAKAYIVSAKRKLNAAVARYRRRQERVMNASGEAR
jgi:RNA polymerase sigma-70 factor, ECF subfamily